MDDILEFISNIFLIVGSILFFYYIWKYFKRGKNKKNIFYGIIIIFILGLAADAIQPQTVKDEIDKEDRQEQIAEKHAHELKIKHEKNEYAKLHSPKHILKENFYKEVKENSLPWTISKVDVMTTDITNFGRITINSENVIVNGEDNYTVVQRAIAAIKKYKDYKKFKKYKIIIQTKFGDSYGNDTKYIPVTAFTFKSSEISKMNPYSMSFEDLKSHTSAYYQKTLIRG